MSSTQSFTAIKNILEGAKDKLEGKNNRSKTDAFCLSEGILLSLFRTFIYLTGSFLQKRDSSGLGSHDLEDHKAWELLASLFLLGCVTLDSLLWLSEFS